MGRAIAARRPDLAAAALARWREHGEVVIEITDHRTRGSTHRAARMLRLAREAGVTAVLTNAVRYLDPPDAAVAQVLDAARQLAPLSERHLARRNARAYLASGEEMAAIAARVCDPRGRAPADGVPGDSAMTQLLHATAVLAERCTLDPERDLGLGGRFMPETTGGAPLVTLRMRCAEGLRRRYPGVGRIRGHARCAAAPPSGWTTSSPSSPRPGWRRTSSPWPTWPP